MRLKDKVAIITGAGQGLGSALAERLVKEGCKVVIAEIDEVKGKRVAERLKNELNAETVFIQTDVTKSQSVKDMVSETLGIFNHIDILIANAGIVRSGDIVDFSEEDWRKVMDVNLTGYFLCLKEVAKIMREQKSGCIIQVNSKSGKKGSFRHPVYPASKFGGIGLTQSAALDLAPYGVRVNAVCPGNLLDSPLWVDNLYDQYSKRLCVSKEEVRKKYLEQVPLGRPCTYEDVANVVVFLASEESSYMTGQAINVTGGQEMR